MPIKTLGPLLWASPSSPFHPRIHHSGGGGGDDGGRVVMVGHNGTKVCGGEQGRGGARPLVVVGFPVVAESGGAATDGTPLFWDFQRA